MKQDMNHTISPVLVGVAIGSLLLAACEVNPMSRTGTAIESPRITSSPSLQSQTPEMILETPTPSLFTPAPTESEVSEAALKSPDGRWKAVSSFTQLGETYRVRLVVSSTDDKNVWAPVDYTQSGVGYENPIPKAWSPDSRYFFYSMRQVSDGGCDFFPIESAWSRLDVETGSVTAFKLPTGRGFGMSPNGRYLAFGSLASPSEPVILDLQRATSVGALLPGDLRTEPTVQIGDFLWDPGSSEVVFVVATKDFCTGGSPVFHLLSIDAKSMALKTLIAESDVLIHPKEWPVPNELLVVDWNGRSWWIDAASGAPVSAPN